MEVLFHFIFELVKIVILSSIYAIIILFVFKQINKSNPKSWFQKLTTYKTIFWFSMGALISILLFIWMFTYWGNHGLGDYARIPIGNNLAIENINWNDYGYINGLNASKEDGILRTSRFKIANNCIVGNLCRDRPKCNNGYFIYQIKTHQLIEFNNEIEYSYFANKENLPSIDEFLSFEENYKKYWIGWRFWLLP